MNPVNTDSPLSTEVAALREWARITAEKIYQGTDPELQEELERTYNTCVGKRRRSPEPDLQAGPIQCTAGSDGRGSADLPRAICTKRQEAGDRAAAQRGETQEQRIGRTPTDRESRSKLGTQVLGRTLAVLQGVYPPLPPGATMTETTLGQTESRIQAWNEGGRRTDDAHDEEETDRERWERLMRYEEKTWKCNGCGGKEFSDRGTLQRHCRSSVHAKKRDIRKCPHCTKEFKRQSGLTRHIKEKHI